MVELLAPGLIVDVVLEGGWRRTATITAAAQDALILEAPGDSLSLPTGLNWCNARLEWRQAGAAACTTGVLHVPAAGVLRLVPISGPLKVQRRRFIRVPVELPAAVVDPDAGRLLARTQDLSIGGMLLRDMALLGIGGMVRFALDLEGETVSGHGEVIRGTTEGARAVRFDDLNQSGERTLSHFVARVQREHIALH